VELLLREFERVTEAPDAVDLLRRLVLDLAVRGRLVPQYSRDQPACEHLKCMVTSASMVSRVQPPYPAPPGWTWVRLGDFMRENMTTVDASSAPNTQFRLWSVPSYFDGQPELVVGRDLGSPKRGIVPGDILLSKINPHLNRVWLTGGFDDFPQIASSEWLVINPRGVSRELLKYFLTSPYFLAEFSSILTGIGGSLRRVRPNDARAKRIPIPPLAEQQRIVAKVDELMALCDQLDVTLKEREARRDRLRAASLHRATFNQGRAQASAADVQFLLDRSPRLITKPEHVAAVRQAILDLAVRGRLAPQHPADEPADVLLTQIAKRRTHAVARHLPPKLSTQPASEPDGLPPTWEWATLAAVCVSITDGDHQPPPKSETGIPFLVISNVRSGRVDYQSTRHVSESYYARLDEYHRPRKGDVLYTLVGSYGLAVPVRGDEPFCVQRHIGILRPEPEILQTYVLLTLRSTFSFAQATDCATGIAQKTVPLGGLRSLLVPLPPLAEQQRIVAKVDQLMAVCDELEGALAAAQGGRRRLLEALLHEALRGAAVPLSVEARAG
jgi:type I restriction enzyme S subunit